MKHIGKANHETLKINLISNEAYKTSEIEEEILNRDSLQSSIRKHFGLKTDHRRIPLAEQGIAEMRVDLYQNSQLQLNHEQLFAWYEMLTNGRCDLTDVGTYRTHEDPMQVVSGVLHNPTVHYEAPPSAQIKSEMNQYIRWFNGKSRRLGVLIRSGIAHLYFESIHPFEDRNGRIGRAISEKALSQSLKRPTLIAISHTMESEKKEYYYSLQKNSLNMEIANWLDYFCKNGAKDSGSHAMHDRFPHREGKFYNHFTNQLNPRQSKVLTLRNISNNAKKSTSQDE